MDPAARMLGYVLALEVMVLVGLAVWWLGCSPATTLMTDTDHYDPAAPKREEG